MKHLYEEIVYIFLKPTHKYMAKKSSLQKIDLTESLSS